MDAVNGESRGRKNHKRWPLRVYVIAMVTVAILCWGAILLLVLDRSLGDKSRREAEGALRRTAVSASGLLVSAVDEELRDIEAVAKLLSAAGPEQNAGRLVAAAHESYPEYSWIGLVGTDGVVRHADGATLQGRNVKAEPWFVPSLHGDYVGESGLDAPPIPAPVNSSGPWHLQDRHLIFAVPVKNSRGETTGVAAASLGGERTGQLLRLFGGSMMAGQDLMVLDKDGVVQSGPPDLLGKTFEIPPSGEAAPVRMEDGQWILAAAKVGDVNGHDMGWTVLSRLPLEVFQEPERQFRITFLLVGVPAIGSLLLLSLFLAARITSPLEKLALALHEPVRLSSIRGYEEVVDLAEAFGALLGLLAKERARIETEVEARTAELQELLKVLDAHAIVSVTDGAGNILHVNDKFCEVSGYGREELLGRNHRLLKSGHHPPEIFEDLWRTISRGGIWRGVLCNRAKDGHEYWVQSTIAPATRDKGVHRRYISIRTDITDVVHDREMLEGLSQDLMVFRQIFDNTNEAVDVMDGKGNVTYTNPAREHLIGVPLLRAAGQHFSSLVPPDAAPVLKEIEAGLAAGTGWHGNLQLQRADGSVFMAACNFGVIRGKNGEILHIFNIFHDVTLEVARLAEVRAARESAEVANRAKSEFLSNMSHELRTPLNAVIGFAQLLLSSKANPLNERQRKQVEHIRKGGEYLLHLINEILEFAKVEAGKLSLSIESVSFRALLDECAELAGVMMGKYDVTLIDGVGEDTPNLLIDRVRTKQVILNLLSNAAKYNRRGGTVRVTSERLDDGYFRVTIADTGMGIEPARQGELFQPFNRLGAENSEVEGSGIGLALTRKLVEAMNGRIDFDSVPGEGSRFWIDLPQAEDATSPGCIVPMGNRDDAAEAAGGKERLMLYIEDNPTNLALMENLIEEMPGWELISAHTAELRLALAEEKHPDLIVCDINLPGMDGIEAIERLKRIDATRDIPVCALSADATPATASRARAAGCVAYLTKPLRIPHLMAAIQGLHDHAPEQ